jgi:tRNA (guanine37-N1)-methyltransferase
MKGVKTKLEEAENTKKKLTELNMLNLDYKIKKDNNHIYFPLKEDFENNDDFEIIDLEFDENIQKEKNLKMLLKEHLSDDEMEKLKTSFDVIGSIAILEIDDDMRKKEQIIAKTLLETHKNIRTVLRKDDKHTGEFRTQKMKWIAGEKTKEAEHKENNVTLKLNVEEVYFSPRLSSERKRISQQVVEGEDILVMFSGCAPYPCVLAKNTEARHITGIELNPQGHEYGLRNLELNKIRNVTLINGDVKKETNNVYKNIIGLKSNIRDLQTRLEHEPKVFEFHLFKEDIYENKHVLEDKIDELKKQGIEVLLHMPFPINGEAILEEENPESALKGLKILGDTCKKHDVKAIIHITAFKPKISEDKLINNIKKLKEYYNQFYFENLTIHFNTAEDIIRIGKKAGMKNICVDIAHFYKVYEDTEKIIKQVKEIQKHFKTYFHLSDSNGLMDGLIFGEGGINIDEILPYVNKGITEIISKDEMKPEEMIKGYKMLINKKRTYDRILMPLPKNAEDFLDAALSVAKRGTKIHFYNFLHEDEFDEAERKVKEACKKNGFEYKKEELIKCGQQSPRTYRICLDFTTQ